MFYNGTEKDYAVEHGKASAGRGRMSLEAKAFIEAAKAKGVTFRGKATGVVRDAAPKGPTVSKDAQESPVEVKADVNPYADAFMRYPLDQKFTYDHEGKAYSVTGRTACMTCGYSMVGHVCDSPVGLTMHGQKSLRPKGE